MKRILFVLILCLSLSGAALANTPPEVTNVVAVQRPHTALIDLTFDVADADEDLVQVSVWYSIDDGVTWDQECLTVSGDVGPDVVPGTGLSATWDAGADFPDFINHAFSLRVYADDGSGEIPPGSLQIEFTTFDMGGFSHEKHVLAVWVETESVEFVKTQLVYADVRIECLYTWNGEPANSNSVDAITGATQLEHKTYTVIWDCSDLDGEIISNGNYVAHLEMNNNYSQGPLAELDFTMDGNSFAVYPEDEEFFKTISLVYQSAADRATAAGQNNQFLTIGNNPAEDVTSFTLNLKADELVTIEIFDEKFNLIEKIVDHQQFPQGRNVVNWKIDSAIANGTYIVSVSTKTHVWFGEKLHINR